MTWTAAIFAERRPALEKQYLPYVRHGVACLQKTMWDRQNGGFYWGLGVDGRNSPQFGYGKHMCGSFRVYALASAYKVDPSPLTFAFAHEAFAWIEHNAHDEVDGGYREWLTREGRPMLMSPYTPNAGVSLWRPYGSAFKAEAPFSSLRIWPRAELDCRFRN